jgi:hypothetical protein
MTEMDLAHGFPRSGMSLPIPELAQHHIPLDVTSPKGRDDLIVGGRRRGLPGPAAMACRSTRVLAAVYVFAGCRFFIR